MERILIIGCGGSGKSTLARQLGQKTGLPVVHLDKLFWKPGWVESSQEEIDQKITEVLETPRWIMDGNFNRTMETRLERCDTVIWLDYGRVACLMGVIKRILTTYGTVRLDMAEGCPERLDLDFLLWVWNFNKKHRTRYRELLSRQTGKTIHIFKNRRQLKAWLHTI